MAVPAYSTWDRAGRPWRMCTPLAQFVARLEAGTGGGVVIGTIGDESHLQSNFPEDHTPFSYTEWPVQLSDYVVCAGDVMSGVNLDQCVTYWLAEARAGRFPSLKYLIYKDKIYTVWRGFVADPYSGQYHSHAHLSFQTDHEAEGLGSWSPMPGGDMADQDWIQRDAYNANSYGYAMSQMLDEFSVIPGEDPTVPGQKIRAKNHLATQLRRLETKLDELLAAIAAIGTSDLDVAAILAGVAERLAEQKAALEAEVRDAVADLGEGGAAKVRADH